MYNYGVGVFLSGSFEDGSKSRSYYTKKFFARGSHHFFRRPSIEAKWDSTTKDDRGKLVTSSPFRSDDDNKQTIYYKNYFNGTLKDLHANPKFSLTTDKSLTEKVALPTTSSLNSISDAAGSDYTKNAFAEFKIANASAGLYANMANTWIIAEYIDPSTLIDYKFVLFGKPGGYQTVNAQNNLNYPDVYPISIQGVNAAAANTAQNRSTLAGYIPLNLNALASGSVPFSNYFYAEAIGEKVRIYTKVSGDTGAAASSVSIHHFSGSNKYLDFDSFNATTNANDTDFSMTTETEYDTFVDEHWAFQSPVGWWGASVWTKNIWGNAGFGAVFSSNQKFVTEKRKFSGNKTVSAQDIETTKVATGVYKAEFKIPDNIVADSLYEKWWIDTDTKGNSLSEEQGVVYGHGGSKHVTITKYEKAQYPNNNAEYTVNITNLKPSYSTKETVKFNVFVRERGQNQNIYTKATDNINTSYLAEAYYQIKRIADNFVAIPYSTGSVKFSSLDYDSSGNSFDLDLSLLEPNYSYEVSFLCKKDVNYIELQDKFKFRVDP